MSPAVLVSVLEVALGVSIAVNVFLFIWFVLPPAVTIDPTEMGRRLTARTRGGVEPTWYPPMPPRRG